MQIRERRIDYLGVVVGRNQLKMDPKKVKGVRDWKTPRSPTDIRKFLEFTGFYRYFIEGYSSIACPLLDLTKKASSWLWGKREQNSFETLKEQMCAHPVLQQPNFNKRFYLQTDASGYGLGAVLSQEGGPTDTITQNSKGKPKLHPIAYYSATFTPTE
jgi:hypothetical protein